VRPSKPRSRHSAPAAVFAWAMLIIAIAVGASLRGWDRFGDVVARTPSLAAGKTGRNVSVVGLGLGVKTLSNYTNHVADTTVDFPRVEALARS